MDATVSLPMVLPLKSVDIGVDIKVSYYTCRVFKSLVLEDEVKYTHIYRITLLRFK